MIDERGRSGCSLLRSFSGARFSCIAAVVGVALTAAACSSNSGPSEGALTGKTPTAIVSTSVKAYHAQTAVHFVTKTITGSQTTTQVGATSATAAVETVQSGKQALLDAVLSDGVAYLRSGSQLLQNTLGLSATAATAHAGSWISLQKGNTGYSVITQSLASSEAIAAFLPEEPGLKVDGATSFSGHDAVAVQGSPAGQLSPGSTAIVTIFVSTTAPYLPLGATLVVKNSSGKTIESAASVYGKWNLKVDPKPPSGATPITSITG
jgi:hypothetical protein